MELLYFVTSSLFYFIAFVFTSSLNHDEFLKQAHFHELGIQIQHMHEKLFEQCQDVFQTPDSVSEAIIGRRRSVDAASLDLKIELAEKTLEDLILKFGKCTSFQSSTANYFTTPDSLYTTTPDSLYTPTPDSLYTTTPRARHAFQVLRSKNITYKGYQFLVLEVQIPTDGLSTSPNWCYDYRYLCEEFHRRPTGCGSGTGYFTCRDKYNSDMNNGDVLGCNPSGGIASLANTVFPNLTYRAGYSNSFGFFLCDTNCSKKIRGSEYGLSYMRDFWLKGITTMYTVCL